MILKQYWVILINFYNLFRTSPNYICQMFLVASEICIFVYLNHGLKYLNIKYNC